MPIDTDNPFEKTRRSNYSISIALLLRLAAMGDIPPPVADYCWEGRLGATIILLCILYVFMSLRVKAVYGFVYAKMSPRGISGAFVVLATALCTI